MSTRREVIGILGSGKEEHRALVEPLARWIARQGTVSEAVLALRYGRPLILFGPREAFHSFPAELERTVALERVCIFLLSVLRQEPPASG
jgi:hypothetical protein